MQKSIAKLALCKKKLNELKAKLDSTYKVKAAVFNEQLAKVDSEILDFFNETGQSSAATDHGTVYRRETTQISISNAPDFFDWVESSGNLDAVQKRPATTIIRELLSDGVEVPGIEITSCYKVNLRGK